MAECYLAGNKGPPPRRAVELEGNDDKATDAAKNDQRRIRISNQGNGQVTWSQGIHQGAQQETAFSPALALLPKTGDAQDRLPLALQVPLPL